jgi:hypothetical protein
MAKSPIKDDKDHPDEPAEVVAKAKQGKDAEPEVQPHTAAEPYPTGNPPEPPSFESIHPHEARVQAEAEEADKAAAKAKAKEK